MYDDAGQVLKVAVRRYAYTTPEPGWAEGDPEAWWTAFCEATRELQQGGLGLDQIEAIAFTGQMHSAVLLDAAQRVLPPTILWLDRRAAEETEELQKQLGTAALSAQQHVHPPEVALAEPASPRNSGACPHHPLAEGLSALPAFRAGEHGFDRVWRSGVAGLAHRDLGAGPTCANRPGRRAFCRPFCQRMPSSVTPRPTVAAELGLNPNARIITGVGDVAALIGGAPPRPGESSARWAAPR